MLDFIRIACAVPAVRVGDTAKNAEDICAYIEKADARQADIVLFPELALTGYSCQDLFFQDTLWTGVQQGIRKITDCTKNHPGVTAAVGLPVRTGMRMYNCAAVISRGKIHALVPKTYIPNYNEFYEKRWFSSGAEVTEDLAELLGEPVPILPRAVFRVGGTLLGVEICEDMWTPLPPSTFLALNGAEVILNLSASNETIGKRAYRRGLVQHQSAALNCVYAYCSAGSTESTQDLIFSGQSLIGEDGRLLAETEEPIASDYMLVCDCDLGRIRADRMKNKGFKDAAQQNPGHPAVLVDTNAPELRGDGTRYPLAKLPFVPTGKENRVQRCMEIFHMQVAGLKQRLAILGSAKAVVGISGGLDSTLALLVSVEAMRQLGRPASDVCGVTMPCFGTSDRTYNNSWELMRTLGISCKEINIKDAVNLHFSDIGHDPKYPQRHLRKLSGQRTDADSHGLCQCRRRYRGGHRRFERAGPRLVYLQRRPHEHVRRERLHSQDPDPLDDRRDFGNARLRPLPGGASGHSGHPHQPGAAAPGRRGEDRPAHRGLGRPLRAA